MWGVVKSTDNRAECKAKRLPRIKGRTWTRRCQWLESADADALGLVKLKFTEGERYVEVLVNAAFAQKVWDRFKGGASIDDSLSFFGVTVPKAMKSRKGG